MYDRIYSLWDILQILGTIFGCWFCYKEGKRDGIMEIMQGINDGSIMFEQSDEQK